MTPPDFSPPTAADYAWDSASTAQKSVKRAHVRIDQLEREVKRLRELLEQHLAEKGDSVG